MWGRFWCSGEVYSSNKHKGLSRVQHWVLPLTNQFPRSSEVLCPLSCPIFSQASQTGRYGCHLGSITHMLIVGAPPPVPSWLLLGMHSAQEFPFIFLSFPQVVFWGHRPVVP